MLIRGEDSARNLSSTLTEEEKWYFDLHGYLILRQVITPDEVLQMLKLGFNWQKVDPAKVQKGSVASKKEKKYLMIEM